MPRPETREEEPGRQRPAASSRCRSRSVIEWGAETTNKRNVMSWADPTTHTDALFAQRSLTRRTVQAARTAVFRVQASAAAALGCDSVKADSFQVHNNLTSGDS